eukprot:1139293-Pelagomonas_calceolata.AAC.8
MFFDVFSRCEVHCPNWPALRGCGQEPLRFYWAGATVKSLDSVLRFRGWRGAMQGLRGARSPGT